MKSLKFLKVQKNFLSFMTSFSTGRNLISNRPGGKEGVTLYFQTTMEISFTEAETTLFDGAACTTLPQSVKFERITFKCIVIFGKTEMQRFF